MTIAKKPLRLTTRLIGALGKNLALTEKGEMRLCILNYHRVLDVSDPLLESEPDIGAFRWQIELLANCFNVIPLYDAVVAFEEQRMPPKAVCITFDDGYRSTYDRALPVLKEYGLPATVFVTTGEPNEKNMWNDRILESIRRFPKGLLDMREVGLGVHHLETLEDRKRAVISLTERSKYLPPDARHRVVRRLEALAGGSHPQALMLTREMISALANNGIEIGGHTISHPILTSLEDEAARHEIVGGKQQLEAITGKSVRLFAYPNGKAEKDFNARHVQMVKDAGYFAAFTTARDVATQSDDRYQLPRSRPWDSTPLMFGIRLLSWFSRRPL
jgi:peptidoglycan/xylan/chitin deacetylase (PgdA/CDA1 family)